MIAVMTDTELTENGSKFVIDFLLINNTGKEIKTCFQGGEGSWSTAYDNLGNKCTVHIASIEGETFANGITSVSIPAYSLEDKPTYMKAIISGFAPDATHFRKIMIHADKHCHVGQANISAGATLIELEMDNLKIIR
jgi:hypothetical protein